MDKFENGITSSSAASIALEITIIIILMSLQSALTDFDSFLGHQI